MPKNSQMQDNDPSMGWRIILAFALCFAISIGWSYFYRKHIPQPTSNVSQGVTPSSEKALGEKPSEELLQGPKVDETPMPEEQEIVLENSLVKVTFSSWRAAVKSLTLKETGLIHDREVPLVDFQNPDVQPGALPRVSDFSHDAFRAYRVADRGSDFVLFEVRDHQITLQKKFTLKENYTIDLEITLTNHRKKPYSFYKGYDLSLGFMKQISHRTSSFNKNAVAGTDELQPLEVDFYLAGGSGSYMRKSIRSIKERKVEDFELSWAAMKSKYFTLLAKPLDVDAFSLITESVEENSQIYYACALRTTSFVLAPNETKKMHFLLYEGPKDYDLLKSFNHHFESLLGFDGLWGHLCRGFVMSLHGLNRIFHNYGISIIVLTLIVKFLFYPLSAISFHSMKEMQALKPKLDQIKKKHGSNPKKIQQETMALYKEHNIKPLAGCLPMLVQMPIFIAFYQILMVSLELRGADFLWIKDLARPDTLFHLGTFPVNFLPMLNGAAMFWQQRMTPSDPSQKMMKVFMPVMLTFLFYGFASGLVLYWITNTVITILQQYRIQKRA
ncbi:MAG: membrane protein insertase YidC [Chlamydiae bacterium]|nr:membrane protein insertase YidC [Chlamydiota bacterium]MBI3266224.1 membrane protein insertase YidC [Chlamydiota bacterium]